MSLVSTFCPSFSEVAAYWSWWSPNLICQRISFFRWPCFADFKYLHGQLIGSFIHLKIFCWIYDHMQAIIFKCFSLISGFWSLTSVVIGDDGAFIALFIFRNTFLSNKECLFVLFQGILPHHYPDIEWIYHSYGSLIPSSSLIFACQPRVLKREARLLIPWTSYPFCIKKSARYAPSCPVIPVINAFFIYDSWVRT